MKALSKKHVYEFHVVFFLFKNKVYLEKSAVALNYAPPCLVITCSLCMNKIIMKHFENKGIEIEICNLVLNTLFKHHRFTPYLLYKRLLAIKAIKND